MLDILVLHFLFFCREKIVHIVNFKSPQGASKLQEFQQRRNQNNSTIILVLVVVFYFDMLHVNYQEVKIAIHLFQGVIVFSDNCFID